MTGTVLLANDQAMVTCDDGVTNLWRPATPWSAQSALVDLVPIGSNWEYGRAAGHTPTGTTAVTLVLPDGTHVPATLADGFYLAIWDRAGGVVPIRLEATTPSGVVVLPLP